MVISRHPVTVEGITVGYLETRCAGCIHGEMIMYAAYRVDWVGQWKLMALKAGRE